MALNVRSKFSFSHIHYTSFSPYTQHFSEYFDRGRAGYGTGKWYFIFFMTCEKTVRPIKTGMNGFLACCVDYSDYFSWYCTYSCVVILISPGFTEVFAPASAAVD